MKAFRHRMDSRFSFKPNARFAVLSVLLGAALFASSGCQMFQRSKAWELATSERIPGQGDWTRSDEYARDLQKLLAANGVPNKRVTFRYTVNSRGGEEKSVTQSVVIYRDDLSPKYPWWLMDNQRGSPTWLPN